MENQCTRDVQILVDRDVMKSRTTSQFQLNQDVFGRCVDAKSNYFNEFCLYPPTSQLSNMCNNPFTYDPQFLFSRMLDSQLTTVNDLPDVVSYVRFAGSGDWVPQPQITPVVNPNIVLNEFFTGHNEWFIGTTTVPAHDLPNPVPLDTALVRSQHQLLQLVKRSDTQTFELQFVNVPEMLVADQTRRVVRLYDSGNLRVFADSEHADRGDSMWESATTDQYGSDAIFNTLDYPLVRIAKDTIGTLQSPNGAYLLVIKRDLVSIKYQAFNNSRFTESTRQLGNLQDAVKAQSEFCFQAMNRNQVRSQGRPDLDFVDFRCNCITSDRLVSRVYDMATFSKLPLLTRLALRDATPCQLRKCQILPGEFTNANFNLADTCVTANGFCQSLFPTNNNLNILVAQNCLVDLSPCVTSSDCPLGSSCRNRQCTLNCTSDVACVRANPLASCVNGQCQMTSVNKSSDQVTTWLWVGVGVSVIVVVLLLALIVYYSIKKKKSL